MLCKVWTPSPTRPLGVWLSFLASIALVSSTRLVKHDVHFLPDIVLRVTVDTINLNCQQRLPTLVNGTYPGPPIYLEPEQTTWIRVYNDADVNTTIVSEPFPRKTLAKLDPGQPKRIDDLTQHWHGLSQNLFPFSDGSPEVSQWPIPPGHFFDYELYPPSDLAGTLFYHSHVGFQATTATGPLIVKDAQPPPYAYDDELMLFIGDFYPDEDETIEAKLTAVPLDRRPASSPDQRAKRKRSQSTDPESLGHILPTSRVRRRARHHVSRPSHRSHGHLARHVCR